MLHIEFYVLNLLVNILVKNLLLKCKKGVKLFVNHYLVN